VARIVLVSLAFGLSVVLVGWTIFWPVTVVSQQELEAVRLGFPVPYLEQNQGLLGNPWRTFPLVTRFWSPWNYPTTILWGQGLLDVASIFLILIGVPVGVRHARRVVRGA
jgi:hypothetical protein